MAPQRHVPVILQALILPPLHGLDGKALFLKITAQAYGIIPGRGFIEDNRVHQGHRRIYLLSGQGRHDLVHHNGEADGRRILAKLDQKLIITASGDNIIPCPICICLENDSRIIMILAEHPQIIGHIIRQSIALKDGMDLLQPFNGSQGLGGGCQLPCLDNLFQGTKQLRQFQEHLL